MPKPSKRRFGAYRGEFEVPDSFFDPLPAEEFAASEGEGNDADRLGKLGAAAMYDRRPASVAKSARVRRRRK
jgi:hypothetical protein